MIVHGHKGKSQQPYQPTRLDDTLQSRQVLRAAILLSGGEIEGLANGEQSIVFDGTPLRNPDGTYNFRGVRWELRYGLPDQAPASLLPYLENTITVGEWVDYGVPVVRTVTNPDVDVVRILLTWPQLVEQTEKGDILQASCTYAVAVQEYGGSWVTVANLQTYGKSTSGWQRDMMIDLRRWYPAGASYPVNIRVARTSADSSSDLVQSRFSWDSMVGIVDERLSYPHSAYIALTINSDEFGDTDQTASFLIKGRKVDVPSNYDPNTRAYTGIWDGTFTRAWTDNPAWCLWDLINDDLDGLAALLPQLRPYQLAAELTKWDLYQIGRYCDELVPNGYGGQEPRYTLNCNLATQEGVNQLFTTICAVFAGACWPGPGGLYVTQDAPADPVATVSPANVLDGAISYSEAPVSERYTVAIVTWHNPADRYRAAQEIVEDPDAIRRYGWRPMHVAGLGVASRGQARRRGQLILEAQDQQLVAYGAGLDHHNLLPMDVLTLQDTAVSGVRWGGRVKSATTTQVEVDAPVTLTGGEVLSVVLPDKTLLDRALTNGPGEHTVLQLAQALPDAPQVASMWALSSSSLQSRQIRLVSRREVSPLQYEIQALVHDPNKYARIEQGIEFDEPNYSNLPTGALGRPGNLSVAEYIRLQGSALTVGVVLSWQPSGDIRVVGWQVQYRQSGGAYISVGDTSSPSVEIEGLQSGIRHDFRVRPFGAGLTGALVELQQVLVEGLFKAPDDVIGLDVVYQSGKRALVWDAPQDVRPLTYDVAFGRAISTAQVIASTPDTVFPVRGPGTYWVFARYGDARSAGVAAVVDGTGLVANVVATIDQAAGSWAGGLDNLSVDGNNRLVLAQGAASGTYTIPASDRVQLAAPALCGVTIDLLAYAVGPGDDIYVWDDIYAVQDVYGAHMDSISAEVQIRTAGESGEWGDWKPLRAADYMFRSIDARLVLSSQRDDVAVLVQEFVLRVDVPDRLSSMSALVPVDGLTLRFDPPFNASPTIVATVLAATGNEDVEIYNVTATGADVRVLQGNTTVTIERTVNFQVQGY